MEPSSFPSREERRARARTIAAIGVVALVTILLIFVSRSGPTKLFTPAPPPVIITTGTVQNGDVFGVMLARKGLDSKYVGPIQKSIRPLMKPESIQSLQRFEIVTSTSGVFQKFTYWKDFPVHAYVVTRSSADVYSAAENFEKTVWIEKRVNVEVTKFLEYDLRQAGYDTRLIDNLTFELGENIFGWRIDFFTEQRKGDKLDVLLEEEYMIGEDHPIGGGQHMRVIVASYTGSGTKNKENYAIRYQSADAKHADFYDPEGKAMKRAFLRAPFTKGAFRVSSGFNPHRFHPILRIYRPHHGTDYAASVGTPVSAIGNGTVVRAEWYKGYGNCIDIRHNQRYTSRYGHLSKIAVHRNQQIAQGQYIGRVGNTGLSTGPHLHFEMLVDGVQQNFLRMSFPASASVSKENLPDFFRVRDEAMARLHAQPANQQKQVTMKNGV